MIMMWPNKIGFEHLNGRLLLLTEAIDYVISAVCIRAAEAALRPERVEQRLEFTTMGT